MQYFGFDRSSFGIKTYGFGESIPKLQADFTTGTYKASGVTKTFADLFTFTRAGKAWLVKDTGLQEYASDVPRLDNGLLIEQEATNYAAWSLLPADAVYNSTTNIEHNGTDWQRLNTPNIANLYPRGHTLEFSGSACVSVCVKIGDNPPSYLVIHNTAMTTMAQSEQCSYAISSAEKVGNAGLRWIGDENYKPICLQMESGIKPTTPIVTTITPVTRPADYLLNKIAGTTVTGDWDSTLNLSIVAGKLVHSGYGRIRSLEIN